MIYIKKHQQLMNFKNILTDLNESKYKQVYVKIQKINTVLNESIYIGNLKYTCVY